MSTKTRRGRQVADSTSIGADATRIANRHPTASMPLARRNDLGDSNYAGLEVDVCHDLQRCLKVRYRARETENEREGDGTAVPSPPPPSPPPPSPWLG